jgi:hypothetical protein
MYSSNTKKTVCFLTSGFPITDCIYCQYTPYGKAKNSKTRYECLYHYVIDACDVPQRYQHFPKALNEWCEGCKIIDLNDGWVPPDDVFPVTVVIPDAKHVVFICGDIWSYLLQVSIMIYKNI